MSKSLRMPLSQIAGKIYVWESHDRRRIGKPLTRQAVWYAIKKAVKDAGLDINVSPHSMRKAFAENEYLKHRSLKGLQSKLAHTHLDTTLIYIMGLLEELS